MLAVLTVVVAAGCGGGGGAKKTTGTTAAPAPSTSPGPSTTDTARTARAQAAVLQPSDFPPGWTTFPPDEGLHLDALWQDLMRCLGIERAAQPLAMALSPTYVKGIATQARTMVQYSPARAVAAIEGALTGPKSQECLTQAFTADAERSKPEASRPGPSTVSPLQVPPAGQKTLSWRVTLTMFLSELQVPIFQDFLVVFDGERVMPMFFLNPGSPFPPDLERQLVQDVVGRA